VARLDVSGVRLIMWDLGGHQDLHGIWEKYYSEAHAVVFVVDGTDREMLDQARLAYSML
jgi:ADP-ribosylation factor related protein 1